MTRPMVRIHDVSTDTVVDREMNDAEFAQYEIDKAAAEARAAEEAAAKAEADAAKAAVLSRLGITADEARLLLS